MERTYAQGLAAVSGWVAFIGIVAILIVFPTALAGNPPTMATPLAEAMAYFRHQEFVVTNAVLAVFVGIVAIVPFGLGVRSLVSRGPGAKGAVLAEVGLLLLIVALPVYVVSGALGASLTTLSDGDPALFGAIHGFYQLLYNGAADVLEGAWIGAFSVASLSSPLPRWIGWLGIAAALARWIKAFMPVVALPDAITLVSGVLFVAWFLAVVVRLTMEWRRPATEARFEPAA